jgi:hypothetical protein
MPPDNRISLSVDALAIQAEWNGEIIRVLDPISLLACKLELVASVPQEKRRDVTHLKILVPCVRAFLAEFLHRVEHGEIPARHWLGAANQVLKLTTASRLAKDRRPGAALGDGDGAAHRPCHGFAFA